MYFPRQVVATNGRALTSAYSKYLHDKDIVTAAVTLDGSMLRHAAPELRADAEVVLAAVTQVPTGYHPLPSPPFRASGR